MFHSVIRQEVTMRSRVSVLLTVVSALLFLTSYNRSNYYKILTDRNFDRLYIDHGKNPCCIVPIEAQDSVPGNNMYTLTVPRKTDLRDVTLSFDFNGYALFVDGERQKSGGSDNDFSIGPLVCSAYSYDGRNDGCPWLTNLPPD